MRLAFNPTAFANSPASVLVAPMGKIASSPYSNHHHPCQMPDCRHHDPHIEGKLIRAGLCEEVAFKEHAGPFAELNDRADHAFRPEGEVRRSVEGDGIEVRDMADLVRALGAGVLTGHDIAAKVDRDGVGAVHAAFLA